jgi:phosphotransacetylase
MVAGHSTDPRVHDGLVDSWLTRLEGRRTRIAFADGDDERVRTAAGRLTALGVDSVLLCEDDEAVATPGVEVLVVDELARGRVGDEVQALLRARGKDEPLASALRADPTYLAMALTRRGDTHATVAGSARPTPEVLRAGMHVIGLAEGVSTLTSSFLLHMPDGRRFCFADCAVIPEPTVRQLADIAQASALTFAALTGEQPVVALLSFSTKGSAEHPTLSRLREARELVNGESPDLLIDDELQFDAALEESVARRKAGASAVAGRANVFVFPDLASGNIGYKIAERLGGARSYGPLLQGLSGVVNDLSRGCTAEDIVNVALISAVQASQ